MPPWRWPARSTRRSRRCSPWPRRASTSLPTSSRRRRRCRAGRRTPSCVGDSALYFLYLYIGYCEPCVYIADICTYCKPCVSCKPCGSSEGSVDSVNSVDHASHPAYLVTQVDHGAGAAPGAVRRVAWEPL
jgi:hypothetical protein